MGTPSRNPTLKRDIFLWTPLKRKELEKPERIFQPPLLIG
jgi:hypothetical protein